MLSETLYSKEGQVKCPVYARTICIMPVHCSDEEAWNGRDDYDEMMAGGLPEEEAQEDPASFSSVDLSASPEEIVAAFPQFPGSTESLTCMLEAGEDALKVPLTFLWLAF